MESSLSPVLLESFRRNGQVNAALLEHLAPADLEFSDGVGGLSIGQHLEHLVGVRKFWLEQVAPTFAAALQYHTLEGHNRFWQVTLELSTMAAAFAEGDQAVLAAVQAAYSSATPFEKYFSSDPAHFLQQTLVHDAHHRGQIIVLLRQHGRTLEEMSQLEGATWPIWKK